VKHFLGFSDKKKNSLIEILAACWKSNLPRYLLYYWYSRYPGCMSARRSHLFKGKKIPQ